MLFGLDRESSILIQLCLNVWIRNCWREIVELGASIQKSFFSRWWLIHVQLFSNLIFALAQDFTSNVKLRSTDYNLLCYMFREVRHLVKNFVFEAVWDLRYCFITWFWAQLTCTTDDWFNWNCVFWCECKNAPFLVRYFSELLNLRSFIFLYWLWIQTCRWIL